MLATVTLLKQRIETAIVKSFGEEYTGTDALLMPATNPKFGDLQANVAMGLSKKVGMAPREVATKIVEGLDVSSICYPPEIAGPGFINLKLLPAYLEAQIATKQADDRLAVSVADAPQRVIVDFSSPNIAKAMHVGHLRSTIIGDAIARILSFRGHDIVRLNHVGDWGTQFGMLICYLQEVFPDALTQADALDIGDLVEFYKQAKARFDSDGDFQEAARLAVVRLQAGDEGSLQAWQLLCAQSRREFQVIYDRLDVELTERGESFYNPFLPKVVADLQAAGILVEDNGAQCVFVDGFTNKDGDPLPLIVQKSDGGFNYATTDLAAIRYRIGDDRAKRIIYVTDIGQANHFAQVFAVAAKAGWIDEAVELVHVPFGLVLGEDGKKIKTRAGETIALKDLLDEAIVRAKDDLTQRIAAEARSETSEFVDNVATKVGLGAVKYADLSLNRVNNYTFSYDKMLALQGNTAPYMLYACARVNGIARKGNIDFDRLGDNPTILLKEEAELTLAKHLLQFDSAIVDVERDLLPNRLCNYLFELSQKFNQFYDSCPVLPAAEPERTSRLILCNIAGKTLKLGLNLLGIATLDRM
jgi:arginyl-tRNA synthetase